MFQTLNARKNNMSKETITSSWDGNSLVMLYNENNLTASIGFKANLIYGDMIYEDSNLEWIERFWSMLRPNSVFIVQTDYHTSAQVKLFLDSFSNSIFINEVIYKQEWGGKPKKGFPRKHDNIFIYANGKNFKWYEKKIEIPKKTAGTKLDKKGTGLKTPCSVFDDLGNFSTISKERIKDPETGKNIQWQKPVNLMKRLMLPFLDKGDIVIDPFMGTGTTGLVAKEIGCHFIGIENNRKLFNIAKERLSK